MKLGVHWRDGLGLGGLSSKNVLHMVVVAAHQNVHKVSAHMFRFTIYLL